MRDEHWREPLDEGDNDEHDVRYDSFLLNHRDGNDNGNVYFFRVDGFRVRDVDDVRDDRDFGGFGVLARFLAGGNSLELTTMWSGV